MTKLLRTKHAYLSLRHVQPVLHSKFYTIPTAKTPTPATSSALSSSTADSGFILSPPPLSNPYTSDPFFQRILSWYLPPTTLKQVTPLLTKFGNEAVSDRVRDWISDAERHPPYVKQYNVWGRRNDPDRLVTSWGWKEAGKWGISNGVVALGYEDDFGPYRRIVQHAHNYIYSASSAVYSCPVSMTSGAARLFQHQCRGLPASHPFHEIYRRLTARHENWISAQWMTERPGGSDVQNTETVATHSPLPPVDQSSASHPDPVAQLERGDYLLSGFKFFSSAPDCDIALLLAKTAPSGKLSLFVAPTRITSKTINPTTNKHHPTQTSNGIRIHRLKTKYGTKPLPTAELVLHDVRAHLVGPIDRGIPTIATLLNVTRTHNFITALSCWRRSMMIAKSFARARSSINQPLWLFPMHLRLLARMEVAHAGCLQLAFYTTSLLSFVDYGIPPALERKDSESSSSSSTSSGRSITPSTPPLPEQGDELKIVLRTLTATSKAVICKVANTAMWECAEAMGGVGYMDEPDEPEFNIVRLMRDTAANMTWEGTTNVLASEVVRHLTRGDNLKVWEGWLDRCLAGVSDEELRSGLEAAWAVVSERLEVEVERVEDDATTGRELRDVLADGREIMFSTAWVVSGMLLCFDAQRDGNEIARETARRWVLHGEGGFGDFLLPGLLRTKSTQQTRVEPSQQPQADPSQQTRVNLTQRANWDCKLVWDIDLPENAALGYRLDKKGSTV